MKFNKLLPPISFLIFGMLFAFYLHATPIKNIPIAHPEPIYVIHRDGYSLSYDSRNKNAHWVYEYLTREKLKGRANRTGVQFREDKEIPEQFRSNLNDYNASGFNRGHLCPAADCKYSQDAMSDTFYLSNISPQEPDFNRGYWKELEKHIRDLTNTHESVEVYTGPLYVPYDDADGKRYVKFQVIGPNDVAVPTHFFKVLILKNSNGTINTQAYILPNGKIDSNNSLERFRTTVEKIERLSGINFSKH